MWLSGYTSFALWRGPDTARVFKFDTIIHSRGKFRDISFLFLSLLLFLCVSINYYPFLVSLFVLCMWVFWKGIYAYVFLLLLQFNMTLFTDINVYESGQEQYDYF